jgi:hypothetical protein
MKIIGFCALLLLTLSSVVTAQTNTAVLRGTVTDAAQAVLPSAAVSAMHLATGQTRTATADEAGNYELSFLTPGAYRLSVTSAGFKTYTQEGITLAAGEIKRLDVTMTAGGASETVTVTANVTAVNSETGELSTGITPKQIESLPLLGRNFNTLIALQPGVRANRATVGLSFNINGGPAGNGFNITLDGTDASAVSTQRVAVSRSGFQQTNTTSVEAMQEIRVYTNLYSAEIGRSTSGAVNVITKSGTNDWHFGVFEYLRNDKLNANSATANAARLSRAPSRFNQFGANASGPVFRNKTFFWAGYEGVRSGRGRTSTYTVLTDAGRAAIKDAAVRSYVDEWIPRPNQPALANNPNLALLIRNETITTREDIGTARVDHQFSAANSMFVRYNIVDATVTEPGLFAPKSSAQNLMRQHLTTVSDTHTFTPSLVNEFRLGGNRFNTPVMASVFGAAGDRDLFLNTAWHLTDTLVWQRGRHALKFGVEYRGIKSNRVRTGNQIFTYTSLNDFFNNTPSQLGFTVGLGGPSARGGNVSGFVQDDWRVSQKLTLNVGARYDYFFVPGEGSGRAWNLKGPLFPLAQMQFTRRGERLMNRDLNNLAPRFGFAWTFAPRWVARGGYGIFYAPQQASAGVTMSSNGRPPVIAAGDVQLAYTQPTVNYTRSEAPLRFPEVNVNAKFPVFTPSFWEPDYRESYAQQWNLTIEHEVFKDTVARLGYVGSKNTKVQGALQFNLLRPLQGNTREDPRFTAIELYGPYFSGVYHAMQAVVSRRLSRGLAVDANYTWSHSIDNFGGFFGLNAGAAPIQNFGNLRAERGESEFDIRHSFKSSVVYELPFRPASRALSALTRGWAVAAIFTAETGTPFSVLTGRGVGDGFNNQRANLVSTSIYTGSRRELNAQILNPAAFAEPTAADAATGYRFGNLGKSALVAPPFVNWDFSLQRNFRFTERLNLQFRAEFFNAFNQVNYNRPVNTLNNPNFGRIQGTTSPREIQFGLKLTY